jgi:hypothetical protein
MLHVVRTDLSTINLKTWAEVVVEMNARIREGLRLRSTPVPDGR